MQHSLDRQIPGSVNEVVTRLVEVLQERGLTVTQPDTGEGNDVRAVDVTDPDVIASATDVDNDAATVGTASISVRPAGEDVRITLLDPVAKATLTDKADLLDPTQRLQDAITQALDTLMGAAEEEDDEEPTPQVSDPRVRQTLLDAIQKTTTALEDLDTRARADTLFVLAKAYTAIVSLERTQEIELHLA